MTDFNDIVSSDEGFYRSVDYTVQRVTCIVQLLTCIFRLLKNLSDYGVSLINGISEPQNASQKVSSQSLFIAMSSIDQHCHCLGCSFDHTFYSLLFCHTHSDPTHL